MVVPPVGLITDHMPNGRHPWVRLAILGLALFLPSAARAAEGGLYLYLQPLPEEAATAPVGFASVAAFTDSGPQATLKLSFAGAARADARRQRLFASGRLPIGTYAGLMVSMKGLDAPVRVDAPFVISAQQPLVLWLTLRRASSVAGGVAPTPTFSVVTPPRSIASNAGFVTNAASNTITVFDKRLAQVVAVIDTCAGPSGMALDQRRRRLFVACAKDDEVQSIDVATGTIVERSRLSPGDRVRELALTPDGNTLVSVNTGSNSVSLFDALSLTRQERISVGTGPVSVAVEPNGTRAFVFNTLSNSLSVIDLARRAVVATLSTEASPVRAQFNRRGDRLYVIHERSPYMTVLDVQQLAMTRVRLRLGVSAIAVDTVRDLICIGSSNDNAVEFYDPNALMPLYSMKTRAGVSFLAFDVEENQLYLLSAEARSVAVARLGDRKVVSEIDAGEEPYAVAVMGAK